MAHAVHALLDRLLRAAAAAFVRLGYRLRVRGRVPAGGALLVANHPSYVDALLVAAAARRRVRFLMHRSFFRSALVRALARSTGTIPIASTDAPEEKEASLGEAARALAAGELVCIFAEGAVTRTGDLGRFRRGLEHIARRARVGIVPVALGGMWGSAFGFARGAPLSSWPERLPRPVGVTFGAPLAPDTGANAVRAAVLGLLRTGEPGGRAPGPPEVRPATARSSS